MRGVSLVMTPYLMIGRVDFLLYRIRIFPRIRNQIGKRTCVESSLKSWLSLKLTIGVSLPYPFEWAVVCETFLCRYIFASVTFIIVPYSILHSSISLTSPLTSLQNFPKFITILHSSPSSNQPREYIIYVVNGPFLWGMTTSSFISY